MVKSLCCLAALLAVAGLVTGQDFGRPVRPRTAYAYIYNNTRGNIRYTVSSAKGATTGVVPPGKYGWFEYKPDGKSKAVTTFYTSNGEAISGRFLILKAGRAYNAKYTPRYEDMVETVPGPDGTEEQRTVRREVPDEGEEVDPPKSSITKPDEKSVREE